MSSASYGIVADSEVAPKLSQALSQGQNMKGVRFHDFRGDPYVDREPDYYLYVFSTVNRVFVVERGTQFSKITLSACPPEQPWAMVARVPAVVNAKEPDENGEVRLRPIYGERFATDLLNPANLGVDIWAEITDWVDSGGTNDLTRRGLFWSRNEVPTAEELSKCKLRLEKHYKEVLLHADRLARENRLQEIGPEHHIAADYFHVRSTWHVVAELPSLCPNCGENITKGVGFHTTPQGIFCIIDWQKAVNAGIKTKDDVPEDLRWWNKPDPEQEIEHRGPGRPRKNF